jgi:hypothetical protein
VCKISILSAHALLENIAYFVKNSDIVKTGLPETALSGGQ